MSSPNVFAFTNFRAFLRDAFAASKGRNPRWSLGAWARRLRLGGTSSLTMILNGQRDPGARAIERFSEYFSFSSAERRYFEAMISLDKLALPAELTARLLAAMRTSFLGVEDEAQPKDEGTARHGTRLASAAETQALRIKLET